MTKRKRAGWLFILPGLAGVLIFYLIPFGDVVRRSFWRTAGDQFAGLDNYRQVFENQAFRLAAGNTARFVLVCLPLLLGISLGLAVLLKKQGKMRKIMKSAYLVPLAVPAASVVLLWNIVFDKSGILNGILSVVHLQGKDWMNSDASFWVLVFSYIWKNLGYDMILWLAGLGAIPEEQYEAAKVQGAGAWACFRYITLPQLKETLFVTALLSFVNAFRVFREAYLLAGEYPHESIYMLQHLFNNWFVNLEFDKMAAAAVCTGGFLLVVILLLQRVWDKE